MYLCIYLCIFLNPFGQPVIYVSMYVCIYVSMCLCTYLCIFVSMYLYIFALCSHSKVGLAKHYGGSYNGGLATSDIADPIDPFPGAHLQGDPATHQVTTLYKEWLLYLTQGGVHSLPRIARRPQLCLARSLAEQRQQTASFTSVYNVLALANCKLCRPAVGFSLDFSLILTRRNSTASSCSPSLQASLLPSAFWLLPTVSRSRKHAHITSLPKQPSRACLR